MKFKAIFYSGPKVIIEGPERNTREEAEQDIQAQEDIYAVFVYTPWDRTEIVED
jgi:hypothetical protein